MNTFSTIKFKVKIANRFRSFSRRIAKSHSKAMEIILDFFEENEINPDKPLASNARSLEKLIKKRINGVVAIIKDIEKHQTKPTTAMLQLLFEQTKPKQKEPLYVERTMEEIEASKSEEQKLLEHYREQYYVSNGELFEVKDDFRVVLNKLVYTKNTFGANYYRLNIPKGEFKKIEQKLNNENKDDNSETF